MSRFEQACEGDGQVVLLAGEAGIGKSVLLQVLREDISGTPHTWLQTSCAPAFVDTPLHPWSELVRQLLGWGAPDHRRRGPRSWAPPGSSQW